MKCVIPGILVVLLSVACVILSVKLHKQHAAYRLLDDGMEVLRKAHANLAVQETCRQEELSLSGSCVDMQMVVSDVSGRTSALSEMITKDVLVCYFSELHCNLCIDTELNNLSKMTDAGNMPVIILLHAMNERAFRKFAVEKKTTCPIYKTGERPVPLADLERPCYFILTKASGRMISVFIPQKENIPVTESYLKQVREKYFQ